jgi:DNA-binding beta-propeller fold protein YncE
LRDRANRPPKHADGYRTVLVDARTLRPFGRCARSLGLLCLLALALTGVTSSPADAAIGHAYERSFGPDCTEATRFIGPGAVAVDEANSYVYVADQEQPFESVNEVFRCTTSGAEAKFTAGPGAGTNHIPGFAFQAGKTQIAVSPTTHDFYVADYLGFSVKAYSDTGEEALFTAGPGAGTNELNELFGFPCGVATDASGDIYVASLEGGANAKGAIAIYAPNGEELTTFETNHPCNLGVDSHGSLYVNNNNSRAVQKFTPSIFPVTAATTYTGSLADPGPDFAVAVNPLTDDLLVDRRTKSEKRSQIIQIDTAGNFVDRFPDESEAGEFAESEGLAVDGSTGTVYASDFAKQRGERQVKAFAIAPPNSPVVGEVSVAGASSDSAEVEAQVNPEH